MSSNTTAAWAPTVIRLALGSIFIAHGSQKLFGWFGGRGIEATVQMVDSMGFPHAVLFGWLLALTEFAGGLAVMLGLGSRLASVSLAVVMVVAISKVHWQGGFFLMNQGYEFNLALIGMAMSLVLTGSGKLSLDNVLKRYVDSEDMAPADYREELKLAS